MTRKRKYYGVNDEETYSESDNVGSFWEGLNGLWNDLTGKSAQSAEFEQQEYLLEKEQEFADERNRMQRLKEAGVNPVTAAGGLAGSSSNPTAPQVASNESGVSNAVGTLAGAVTDLAAAGEHSANAAFQRGTLDPTIKKLLSGTTKDLSEAGLADEQARNFAILNTYLPEEKLLSLANLQQSILNSGKMFDVYDKQISLYDAQIRQIDQQIEESKASISLMEAQALVQSKQSLLLDEQTFQLKWFNNVRQLYGMSPELGIENNLLLLRFTNPDNYDKAMQTLSLINYKRSLGEYLADDETAFSRSFHHAEGQFKADAMTAFDRYMNEFKGRYEGEAQYADRITKILADRERIVGMASIYSKNVDGVNGFLGWFLQSLIKMPADVYDQIMGY